MGSALPPGHQTDVLAFFADDPDIQQGSEADVHQHQGQFQGPATMFQFAPSSPSSPQHPLGIRISMPPQQQPRPSSQSQSQSQITMDMFGDLMQMPFQGLDSNSSQTSTSSSMPTGASITYNSQLLLEHQFRLTQLQQLQQLQQQIFQQQVCANTFLMVSESTDIFSPFRLPSLMAKVPISSTTRLFSRLPATNPSHSMAYLLQVRYRNTSNVN